MPDQSRRPRSGKSAKSLLLTILGELVLPRDGAVWTSTIVAALGTLDIEERNARQAVSRLAGQGLVEPQRVGRRARWHLTPPGRELLTTGTERIYGFGAADDARDDRWLVVLCSVPEEQRAKRHQLRSQLAFAGFGFLGPGIAVSPHLDREQVAADVLKELDLLSSAIILRAEVGAAVPADELLHQAWDLESLAERYGEFIADFQPREPRSGETRFAALVELVHAWRHFPFIDPEIPDGLLPASWPGRSAKLLFDELHAAWSPSAGTYFDDLERHAES